jgi:hypothetical protein
MPVAKPTLQRPQLGVIAPPPVEPTVKPTPPSGIARPQGIILPIDDPVVVEPTEEVVIAPPVVEPSSDPADDPRQPDPPVVPPPAPVEEPVPAAVPPPAPVGPVVRPTSAAEAPRQSPDKTLPAVASPTGGLPTEMTRAPSTATGQAIPPQPGPIQASPTVAQPDRPPLGERLESFVSSTTGALAVGGTMVVVAIGGAAFIRRVGLPKV